MKQRSLPLLSLSALLALVTLPATQAATTNMANNPHVCYQETSVKKQGKNALGAVERIQTESKIFKWGGHDLAGPPYATDPLPRYKWTYIDDPIGALEVYYKDKPGPRSSIGR